MGESLMIWYDQKVKKEWKLAFVSAFVIGLLVHMMRFTNVLPNHDSLFNFYSNQNMLGSGRWFLAIACSLSGFYDLPWVIGLLSLLYLAITAVIVVEMFRIRNPILILLTGGMLVSFPAVTDTVYFQFTADGFMMAMMLAAAGAAMTRMELESAPRKMVRYGAACVLLCLSCGIYQAYISFALVLAICCFMLELLEGRRTLAACMKWIGKQALLYGGALALYYLIWKICMKVQGYVPTHYLGIDQVGTMNVQMIRAGLYDSLFSFLSFLFPGFFASGSMDLYTVLNIVFVVLAVCGVGVCAFRRGLMKRRGQLGLLLLCIAALPVCAYIWYFTTRMLTYSPRMLQSLCILYIFVAVVYERWLRPKVCDWMALVLALTILNNGLISNVFYNYLNLSYERSYASAVAMNAQIQALDDGTVLSIAILGQTNGVTDQDWIDPEKASLGCLNGAGGSLMTDQLHSALFLSTYTDFSLSYYSENDLQYPWITEGADSLVGKGFEFRFPLADAELCEQLEESDEVAGMPIWPASGSVRRIGDTIVIKLADLREAE